MKVFLAGGSGAMGRRLVPQLVAAGYQVSAMTQDEGKASWLGRVGAQPVIADALDRAAVVDAVKASEPEVVLHQLTALTGAKSFKNFDREFALTNRLRTEGNDHLLEAARIVGVRRVVAQSYGNWNYQRTGSAVKTEQDPRGITATVVQGGLIDTDMNPAGGPGAGLSAVTALGCYGSADDIAATVVHLAGDGGRYASGTAITVDGGFTA